PASSTSRQRRRACSTAGATSSFPRSDRGRLLDPETLRVPAQAEGARRCHVAREGGGRDDLGTGEVALTAESHPVLPVPVEGGAGALAAVQRIGALAEAGTAPRIADGRAGAAHDVGDRLPREPRLGCF